MNEPDSPTYLAECLVLELCGELRRKMESQKVTEKDLAKKLNVPLWQIKQWLNDDHDMPISALAILADALDCQWQFTLHWNLSKWRKPK